jgi:heat shock protein HtpX
MSMKLRAVLALALVIGFYTLALGIVAILTLIIIWAAGGTSGLFLRIKLILACGAGAGLILMAIRPRFDRFVAPGPRLLDRHHPGLFALLQEVSRGANQAMPVEVYLIPDVNAFVAQRGGFMGLGGRRIMGIGLPLMLVDTVGQFRATIAHEFGHYHGGDTKLGPWIYAARAAIFRTILTLDEHILQLPFRWYGTLFLRITFAVSRRQELLADELASRIAGARANGDALTREFKGTVGFQRYLETEFMPVMKAGHVPPLLEGFSTFLKAPHVSPILDEILAHELSEPSDDPLNTHPPLKHRLEAIKRQNPGTQTGPDPLAITLLQNVPQLERELLATVFDDPKVRRLPSMTWEEMGAKVLVPSWREAVRNGATVLREVQAPGLPEVAGDLAAFGRRLSRRVGSKQEAIQLASYTVGSALSLALHERGWTIETSPGSAIMLRKGAETVEPFTHVGELAEKKIDSAEWRRRCEAWGLERADFGAWPS